MLAVDIAKNIREKEKRLRESGLVSQSIDPGPADSAIFEVANGMSIAADMAKHGVKWVTADKSPGSRKTGAEKLRARLTASQQFPMEEPGIFIFEDCRQWIRCVPVLPRDPRDTDDVDSRERLATTALFSFIGAEPASEWLSGFAALDDRGFVLTDRSLGREHLNGRWEALGRSPLPFETSYPGLFAVGDVRSGSTKRVAAAVGEGSASVRSVHDYLAFGYRA